MKQLLQKGPYHLIVAYKALKGVFLVLLAFALARSVEKHAPGGLQSALEHWFVPPEREFYANLARPLASITPRALRWATSASFLCALVTLVETVGLLRRWPVLVWLTIVDAGFFLALGIFELSRHFALGTTILALINAFILWYLLRRGPKAAKSSGDSAPPPKKPKKKED